MFGFMIKKTFFDMWDNLFKIVILNIGFIICLGIIIYLYVLFDFNLIFSLVASFIGITIFFLYTGAVSKICKDIADYKTLELRNLLKYLKQTYGSSILFALIVSVFIFLIRIAIPFYLGLENIFSVFAFSFLFWTSLFFIFIVQYFFPVQSGLAKKIRKIIKKMFLIYIDNKLFSLGLFFVFLIMLVLSIIFILLPGFTAIMLLFNVALKLRLYKYDYLEKNPDAKRNKIPWTELLYEDRERVGKRTLKGMIFPWKE